MTYSRRRMLSMLALLPVLAATNAAALDCSNYADRRVDRFVKQAESAVRSCLRRAVSCPDARLATRLDRLQARLPKSMPRRCSALDLGAQLAAARARVLCDRLAQCSRPGSIAVKVVDEASTATLERTALAAGGSGSRRLRANAGWTGIAHDLQILEGAAYSAQLRNCDGETDTVCDLHGAVAGTSFGAPSPISAGGVAVCVTVDFASDLTGTMDLAAGDLTEAARVEIGVFLGGGSDRPCPACVPSDRDPALGEAGMCRGGAHDGEPCVVRGLGDPSLGTYRGTSDDCGAGQKVAAFESNASATTGAVSFGPVEGGPACTDQRFLGLGCPCSTCNDAAGTACRVDIDCPTSGGALGICGGKRCLGGANHGLPCTGGSGCLAGICGVPGASTARNACVDAICTPTVDGHGECLAGPMDARCAEARYLACANDADCPSGDQCVTENRLCHLDTIELQGTPAPMSNGLAKPTLVGAFCMAASGVSSVDSVTGFPGPVSYVWPTEITFAE